MGAKIPFAMLFVLGENISDFESVDETPKQAFQGILAKSRPIEINETANIFYINGSLKIENLFPIKVT